MTYPRWLYSESGAVLLKNRQEEDALGGTWFDSPALVSDEARVELPEAVEADEANSAEEESVSDEGSPDETLVEKPKRGRPAKVK